MSKNVHTQRLKLPPLGQKIFPTVTTSPGLKDTHNGIVYTSVRSIDPHRLVQQNSKTLIRTPMGTKLFPAILTSDHDQGI